MNNTFWQTTLQSLTTEAIHAGKDIISFVEAQAPDVCKQLIIKSIIGDMYIIISMGVFMFISTYILNKCIKLGNKNDFDLDRYIIGIIFGCAGMIVFGSITIYNLYDLTIAIATPKIYLINLLKDFLTTR